MLVHHTLDALPRMRRPVVTIGSFDGVHLGHRALLARIRARAEGLGGESVVVTFDPHPRHVLGGGGPRPLKLITLLGEKIARLRNEGIDHLAVVPFDAAFARQTAGEYLDDFLFGRFAPHTVVIGYDHRYGAGRTGDIALLRRRARARGVVVDELPAQDVDRLAVSSTRIREAVAAGRVDEAAALLGSPYFLAGNVVHGDAIGRTIGFPTANLDLGSPHKLLPADGVYAVRARIRPPAPTGGAPPVEELGPSPAMLYVGERPSLEGKRPRSIEVNLLDYDGDLYGALLQVDVLHHLRDDRSFDSLDALREQLAHDEAATRQRLLAS